MYYLPTRHTADTHIIRKVVSIHGLISSVSRLIHIRTFVFQSYEIGGCRLLNKQKWNLHNRSTRSVRVRLAVSQFSVLMVQTVLNVIVIWRLEQTQAERCDAYLVVRVWICGFTGALRDLLLYLHDVKHRYSDKVPFTAGIYSAIYYTNYNYNEPP